MKTWKKIFVINVVKFLPINDIMDMIGTQPLRNAKLKCKICKRELFVKYNFKVYMENCHKGFKKYKCDECGKFFTQNIGLKRLTYYSCLWKIKRFNCGKNFARGCVLKVHIQNIHEKDFEYNCQHFCKIFTKAFTLKTYANTSWDFRKSRSSWRIQRP